MKKEFMIIDDKKITAKDGYIYMNGEKISEKNQILEILKVAETVLENVQAIDGMVNFQCVRVKRGTSAKFNAQHMHAQNSSNALLPDLVKQENTRPKIIDKIPQFK